MRRVIVMVGLCCLLSNVSARAQSRDVFWISSGVGVGSFDGDGVDPVTGLAGYFGGGVAISEMLLLGVEGSVWRRKRDFGTYNLATTQYLVNAVVYFYPRAAGGPFLKAVFGWGHLDTENSRGRSSENGKALGLGLGYDFGLGDSFSLRAYLNGTITGFTNVNSLREIGAGVSWFPR